MRKRGGILSRDVTPPLYTRFFILTMCNSRRTLRQKADEARGVLILMTGTTHILTLPHGMVTYNDASTFSILPPYLSSLIAKKQKDSNHSNVFILKESTDRIEVRRTLSVTTKDMKTQRNKKKER